MKEATDLLAFFTTQDGIARFFTLLFPGFLAVAVYDLRVPGERRKYGDLGVALVGYSVLIDILAFVFLRLQPIPTDNAWAVVAFVIVAGLVVPCAVGWFIVELRELLAKKGLVLSTMPKAWDYFFTDLAKKAEPVAIVLMLSDAVGSAAFGPRRRSRHRFQRTRICSSRFRAKLTRKRAKF